MTAADRPLADRLEVGAPRVAALLVRVAGRAPGPLRRRLLSAAFDRARDAFNRGDLEAVFALFDPDVEYVPPPPLHRGEPLRGRAAVFEFWREVLDRYEENAIENLGLEETAPGRIVRRARLFHRTLSGEALSYAIVQATELERGRVIRQVNRPAIGRAGRPA
jgi:ketosteroid isomerase-like protein